MWIHSGQFGNVSQKESVLLSSLSSSSSFCLFVFFSSFFPKKRNNNNSEIDVDMVSQGMQFLFTRPKHSGWIFDRDTYMCVVCQPHHETGEDVMSACLAFLSLLMILIFRIKQQQQQQNKQDNN